MPRLLYQWLGKQCDLTWVLDLDDSSLMILQKAFIPRVNIPIVKKEVLNAGTIAHIAENSPSQMEIPTQIETLLRRPPEDDRPVVLMTCGLAGAGKTTLAKAVLRDHTQFTRLSIDEIVFEKHGLYGIDYPADEELHEQYSVEAKRIYLERFKQLLEDKKDIILDRSFYAKVDRDEFKASVDKAGARWVLVYFDVKDKEALWTRICARTAKGKTANSALDITRDTFERYWAGFEKPLDGDEGAIIICVDIISGSIDVMVQT